MQPSPAYVPMSQDTLNAHTIPQYETVQDRSDVQMDTNPAYLSHRNIWHYSITTCNRCDGVQSCKTIVYIVNKQYVCAQ